MIKTVCSSLKKMIAIGFILFTFVNESFSQQPSLTWAKQAGGNNSDYCYDIFAAPDGSIYSAGGYTGTAIFGSFILQTQLGTNKGYVSKSNTNGTILWVKDFGGYANKIAAGPQGTIYVSGYFSGTENFGGISLTATTSADLFLLKMNGNGDVVWGKNFQGVSSNSIVSDASGNIYMGGSSLGATFGSIALSHSGTGPDVFLAKFDSNGTPLWAQKYGGVNPDQCTGLDIDANGNIYVTGYFLSGTDIGTSTFVSYGFFDIFVFKTDPIGGVIWAKQFGGSDDNKSSAIAVDSQGNAYLTGSSTGISQFGSFSATSINYNAYLCKMNPSGTPLWLKSYFTDQTNQANSMDVSIDHVGNIYSTGSCTASYSFDAQHSINIHPYSGTYVIKRDANGNILWARGFGGIVNQTGNYVHGYSVDSDLAGNVYVGGIFSGTIDSNPLLQTNTSDSGYDIFLMKIGVPTVGMDELSQTLFTLYPNPNAGTFKLVNELPLTMYITNSTGQGGSSDHLEAGEHTIELSEVESGVYFISATNSNGQVFVRRISVVK